MGRSPGIPKSFSTSLYNSALTFRNNHQNSKAIYQLPHASNSNVTKLHNSDKS